MPPVPESGSTRSRRAAIAAMPLILAGAASARSFIADLSQPDLNRLRLVVRNVHMKFYPGQLQTDHEADKIIESFGPQVREDLLRKAVAAGMVS